MHVNEEGKKSKSKSDTQEQPSLCLFAANSRAKNNRNTYSTRSSHGSSCVTIVRYGKRLAVAHEV